MADVIVNTASLELRTCKLTKSLLKQMRRTDTTGVKSEDVVGWVHGSVLDPTEDYNTWLVVKVGEGDYVLVSVMQDKRKLFKQIYVV